MATSHYAACIVAAYRELNIKVEKSTNVLNVPQLCLIEKFCSILKQKVYEGGLEASSNE